MPNIQDLPIDIICRLFDFATALVTNDLAEWERALPLLKVCRSWRKVGKRLLYNIAYIQAYLSYVRNTQGDAAADYLSESILGRVHTNIDLIRQNGSLLSIQRLQVYTISDPSVTILSILRSMSSAGIMSFPGSIIEESAHIEELLVENGRNADAEHKQLTNICTLAAQNIAHKIPNVNAVDIVINEGISMKNFIACLVGKYNQQLNIFDYSGPIFFDSCPIFTNLTSLIISTDELEGHRLPPVCAETLRRVSIYIEADEFKWDMLYIETGSDTVSFDNLESLRITGVYGTPEEYNRLDLHPTNFQQKKLRFPSLKNLHLSRVLFRIDDVRSLLQSPLKTLYCCGYPSQILDFCSQGLTNLDNITVAIDRVIDDNPSRAFTTNMNKIFTSAYGVGRMCAIITASSSDFDFSDIFWPNLTHLELLAQVEFSNIIAAILRMPDLVVLKLTICSADATYLKNAVEFLDNFKQYHPEQTTSVLQLLRVGGIHGKYGNQFISSLDVLKLYFPNLKSIEFG